MNRRALFCATAQIDKNHLGDRNEYLPALHGLGEFYRVLLPLQCHGRPA